MCSPPRAAHKTVRISAHQNGPDARAENSASRTHLALAEGPVSTDSRLRLCHTAASKSGHEHDTDDTTILDRPSRCAIVQTCEGMLSCGRCDQTIAHNIRLVPRPDSYLTPPCHTLPRGSGDAEAAETAPGSSIACLTTFFRNRRRCMKLERLAAPVSVDTPPSGCARACFRPPWLAASAPFACPAAAPDVGRAELKPRDSAFNAFGLRDKRFIKDPWHAQTKK
jgi:hypothetical protein